MGNTSGSPYTEPVEENAIRVTPLARIASSTFEVAIVFCSQVVLRMLEPVTYVRVGLEVKHPVTALKRGLERRAVEHVALDQRRTGSTQRLREELAASGAEVINDHHLHALCEQAVGEVAADEAATTGDAYALHPIAPRTRLDGKAERPGQWILIARA